LQTNITNSEEIEQITLFRWASFMENKYPKLRLMYHVPNEGKRSKRAGFKLKQAGLKSGVPDIVLPGSPRRLFWIIYRNEGRTQQDY